MLSQLQTSILDGDFSAVHVWWPKCRHTDFHQPPFLATITAVSYPWRVRNRQPEHEAASNQINQAALNTQWSQLGKETLLKHSSTISKLFLETDSCAAWEPWEATWPFRLEDHPTDQNWIETIRPSNRPSPRLDPIVPLHQASLRLHNLPLSAVQDIPGTGGKTNKTVLRTCQLCLTESTHGVKKIETNRWRCRKPTGWRAGGRRRQRAYGNGMARHPRFLEPRIASAWTFH